MKKFKWTKKAKVFSFLAASVLVSVPAIALTSVACSSNDHQTAPQSNAEQLKNIQIANNIVSFINQSQSHITSIISASIVSQNGNNVVINKANLQNYIQNYVANNLKSVSVNNTKITVNAKAVNISNTSNLIYSHGTISGIYIYYEQSDAVSQTSINLNGFFNPNIKSIQMPLMHVLTGAAQGSQYNQFYNPPNFQINNAANPLSLTSFTNAQNQTIDISSTAATNNPSVVQSIASLGTNQIQNDLITVANSFIGLNAQMSSTKSLTAYTNVSVSQAQSNYNGHIYIQIENTTQQPQYINNWVSSLNYINLTLTSPFKTQMVQPGESFAINISFNNASIVPSLANDGYSTFLSYRIEPNSNFAQSYVKYSVQIGNPNISDKLSVMSSSSSLLGFNLGTKSFALNTPVLGASSALNNQPVINNLYKNEITKQAIANGINDNWASTWGLGFKIAPEIATIFQQLIGGPQGVSGQKLLTSPIQGQTLYQFLTDNNVGNALANIVAAIKPNYQYLQPLQLFIRNLFSSNVSMQALVNSIKDAFPTDPNISAIVNGLADVLQSLIRGAQQQANASAQIKAMSYQQTNLWVLLNAVPDQVSTLINSFIPVLSSDSVASTLPPAVLIIFKGVIYIVQQLASNPSLSNLNGNIMNLHLFGFFTQPNTFQLIDRALNPSLLPTNQNPLDGLLYLIFKYYVFSKNPELNVIYSKIAQYLPQILENFIDTPDFQLNLQQLIINVLYPSVNGAPSTLANYLSTFVAEQEGTPTITTNTATNPDVSFNVWYNINSNDSLSINLDPLINLFSQSGYTINSFLDFLVQNQFVNSNLADIKTLSQNFGAIPLAYLVPENLDFAANDGLTFSYIARNVLIMYKENSANNGLVGYSPIQNSIQMNFQTTSSLIAKSINAHIQKVLAYLTSPSTSPTQNQIQLINELKNVSAFLSFASIFTNPLSDAVVTYPSVIELPQVSMGNVVGYSSQVASSSFPFIINSSLSTDILNDAFNELNASTNNYSTLSLNTLNKLFSQFPSKTPYSVSVVKGEYAGQITNTSKLFLNPEYIVNIDFAVPYVFLNNGTFQLIQGFSFTLRNNMQPSQFKVVNISPGQPNPTLNSFNNN